MEISAISIILLALGALQADGAYTRSVCASGTCGINAVCTVSGDRPVCSCLPGHSGDPLGRCMRLECTDHSDCAGHMACREYHCIDPCAGSCAYNAECRVRDHVPVCSCPPGHVGDPFSQCKKRDPEELCRPSPCGSNTKCRVEGPLGSERAICSCLPGYTGSPLSGCRHECDSDSDCAQNLACDNDFKCRSPCDRCGQGALCSSVQNHRPVCVCPENYYGNPSVSCSPECTTHTDCSPNKPACYNNKCTDPCVGACGVGANCEVRPGTLVPVCSCPRDMTGNPFVQCRAFIKEDLCDPNPCGANSICTPGHDNTGRERPVCTCPPGYIGNALHSCQRGECLNDSECPDNKACIDYSCSSPCSISTCGVNADCTARRHLAVCTCPDGYNGDALTQCTAKGRSRFSYSRSSYY